MTELERICREFVQQQRIRSAESIYQMDHVIQNAYEFIERVCEQVGYYEEGDEDE